MLRCLCLQPDVEDDIGALSRGPPRHANTLESRADSTAYSVHPTTFDIRICPRDNHGCHESRQNGNQLRVALPLSISAKPLETLPYKRLIIDHRPMAIRDLLHNVHRHKPETCDNQAAMQNAGDHADVSRGSHDEEAASAECRGSCNRHDEFLMQSEANSPSSHRASNNDHYCSSTPAYFAPVPSRPRLDLITLELSALLNVNDGQLPSSSVGGGSDALSPMAYDILSRLISSRNSEDGISTSAADALMEDLENMRMLGKGGCGMVYKVSNQAGGAQG